MEAAILERETETLAEYDPAEYINTKEDVIAEFKVALEENDPAFLLSSMEDIIRSEGFSQIARELGIMREGLFQTVAPTGVLTLESIIKFLDILGFRLKLESKTA